MVRWSILQCLRSLQFLCSIEIVFKCRRCSGQGWWKGQWWWSGMCDMVWDGLNFPGVWRFRTRVYSKQNSLFSWLQHFANVAHNRVNLWFPGAWCWRVWPKGDRCGHRVSSLAMYKHPGHIQVLRYVDKSFWELPRSQMISTWNQVGGVDDVDKVDGCNECVFNAGSGLTKRVNKFKL